MEILKVNLEPAEVSKLMQHFVLVFSFSVVMEANLAAPGSP